MLAATSTAPPHAANSTAPGAARRGFSLVEATVALTITAVAGSALLLSVQSSMRLARDSLERTLAIGMAQQLMDEVVGARYMAVGADPYQIDFTPSAWELATGTRERFDDVDDYDGWDSCPAEDRFGVELGTDDGQGGQRHPDFRAPAGFFDDWQRQVRVDYVRLSDLSEPLPAGHTSDYRAVEVRIIYNDPERGPRELARLRQVVVYVPPL